MSASLTISRNGVSGGFPGNNGGKRGDRRSIVGWSRSSARGNLKFLMSINGKVLPRRGFAITLTVRDLPKSGAEWQYRIKEILRWARRNGADMYHWVTEFTRKRRPHLHMCVYVGERDNPGSFAFELVDMWLEQTKHLATSDRGQYWRVIDTLDGWLEYVGKHASRGYEHYQRDKDSLPASWTTGTGKMWGCSRNWPRYTEKYVLSDFIWFEYRRLVKRWSIAQARTKLKLAINYSGEREQRRWRQTLRDRKRLYTRNEQKNSAVVGISQWLPCEISELMLFYLAQEYPGQLQTKEEHDQGPFVPF